MTTRAERWAMVLLACAVFLAAIALAFPPYRAIAVFDGKGIVRFNSVTGSAVLCLPDSETEALRCRAELPNLELVPIE